MACKESTELQRYMKALEHGNICQRAAAVALESAWSEGSHHKQWIIDQMLCIISGEAYDTMMEYLHRAGIEWDTGIAP